MRKKRWMQSVFPAIILTTFIVVAIIAGCSGSGDGGGSGTGGGAATLTGTVTDAATAAAIANVVVTIGESSTATGENGIYTLLNLTAGTYTLTVSKTGYQSFQASIALEEGSNTKDVSLNTGATQEGTLTGTVTSNGSALTGVVVNLADVGAITTGADGTYSFANVLYGTHTLRAEKDGYNSYNTQVIITSAATTHNIELVIQNLPEPEEGKAHIEGQVVGINGEPLENVKCTLYTRNNKAAEKVLVCYSDGNGRYFFLNVNPGSYQILFYLMNYNIPSVILNVNSGDVGQPNNGIGTPTDPGGGGGGGGGGTPSPTPSSSPSPSPGEQVILSTNPANNATGVPIQQDIVVTCSENIVPVDLNQITMVDGNTNNVPITVTNSGKELFINPTALLLMNTQYTVTIPGNTITDIADQRIITFTTVNLSFNEVTGVQVSTTANASIGRSDTSKNVAVSDSGVIHVVWKVPNLITDPPGPNDGIYYTRSTNGGTSFEAEVKVRDAANLPTVSGSYIEPEITSGGLNDVYICFPNKDNQMEILHSADSGANWGNPVVAGNAGTISEQKHIVANGNNVYVSSNDGGPPVADSVDNGGNTFMRSVNKGAAFDPQITGMQGYPLHQLLLNPLNGDIYIVGTEATGVNEATAVFYQRSQDNGQTFQASVDTSQVLTHAGYCFDRQGRIIIVGRTGTMIVGDMNTDTWTTTQPMNTTAKPLQSDMTVDGENAIYRIGTNNDNNIHLNISTDGGVSFSDLTIEAGTYPNIASSVNISGAGIVYNVGGVIRYSFRKPAN